VFSQSGSNLIACFNRDFVVLSQVIQKRCDWENDRHFVYGLRCTVRSKKNY